MSPWPAGERGSATGSMAVLGTAFAVICCAGLPLLVGVVGGLTALGVVGVGGAAALLIGAFALRRRTER